MIVQDTDRIKEYTGINRNIRWTTLRPFVMSVEATEVKAVLGNALYEILETNITASLLSPAQAELLDFIYPMIANFSLYHGSGQLNIHISELGIQQQNSEEHTSAPAEVWRYNEAKYSLYRQGDMYRELAFKFLQENQADFPEWVASSAYTWYIQYLLRNNNDLHQAIGKGENVGTYLAMRPYIDLAQSKYLNPALCGTYLSHLLSSAALSALDTEAARIAKTALGWLALYESLPAISFIVIDGTIVTSMPGNSSRQYAPISLEEKKAMKTDAYEKGQHYLGQLALFLETQHANLPDYSTCISAVAAETCEKKDKSMINITSHSIGISQ